MQVALGNGAKGGNATRSPARTFHRRGARVPRGRAEPASGINRPVAGGGCAGESSGAAVVKQAIARPPPQAPPQGHLLVARTDAVAAIHEPACRRSVGRGLPLVPLSYARPPVRCVLCDEPLTGDEAERRVTRGGTVVYLHRACLERVEQHRRERLWDQNEES